MSPHWFGLGLATAMMSGLLVGPTGCSSTRLGPSGSPPSATPSALPADAPGAPSSEFTRLEASFSWLETIAGKGESDSGNEWRPEFEGGPAVEAELSRPHIALADAAGNVFIADKEAHAIRRVSPEGTITTVAGVNHSGDGDDSARPATEVRLSSPNGLWVEPDGTLYVLDLGNGKIRKRTPDGMMRTLFRVPGGISTGRGLWVAPDESEAYVCAGTKLLRWTPASGIEVEASGFFELGMVVKDQSGRLWVGDRRANRVFEIRGREKIPRAGDGSATSFVEGRPATETPMAGPRAVWPYRGGFFVGLHDGSRVAYVEPNGTAHTFLDGAKRAHAGDGLDFAAPGPKVSEVRSVAVSSAGDLIVVENDLGFVRKVHAARR